MIKLIVLIQNKSIQIKLVIKKLKGDIKFTCKFTKKIITRKVSHIVKMILNC